MLVDVNASFALGLYTGADAGALNAARLRAGAQIGITLHVVTIATNVPRPLGQFLPSSNDAREGFERVHPSLIRWLALPGGPPPPSPEDPAERVEESVRWELARDAARGAVGVELEFFHFGVEPWHSAVVDEATRCSLPVRVSSRADAAVLAVRHPLAQFVLAALGDDPNWLDTIAAFAPLANVAVDISGRRTVRGMLDEALTHLGAERLLWGTGDAMETGLAQLRALDVIAPGADVIEAIRWRNAARIFPRLGI
jgi:hypothetical protein